MMPRHYSQSVPRPAFGLVAALITLALFSPAYCQTDGTALLIEQSPVQGGRLNLTPGVHTFDKYAEVTLTATPNPGWQFVYWLGDVTNATSSTTIVYLDNPKIVIAVFERAKYEYTDITDRAQLSLGYPGMIPSGADYSRQGYSGGGGRRRLERGGEQPPEEKEPEFPVPETEAEFPVPETEPEFPVPVPEPASMAILVLGAMFVLKARPTANRKKWSEGKDK